MPRFRIKGMAEPDVFEGAMRIARVEYPGLDAEPYRARLDAFEKSRQWLGVFRPVMLDHENIGTVYIRSDLGEMQSREKRYAWIVMLVLLTSSCVAFVLSSKLQGVISSPLFRGIGRFEERHQARDA